ncbi:MAG TPA: S-methyl-5'-thioadenosine phosphorylase [Hellea balneolensis]|uniref:S-methyl-5'-thioadenosine phosphorylase n=1 Tax=Hellea balneolensis TaxID=287478 RepID=A0A7C5M199_9PROT|nr:S-methyl-5'-thioadenosine phosphorylase [Hellea balneolensis]
MSEIVAIIGGTGIYALEGFDLRKEIIKTEYGNVTVERTDSLIFLNRHAPNHSVPPHKVNYRANIKALQQAGVKRLCAAYAVGCINPDFDLGIPVILDDFIDFSSGREHSFFDTITNGVGHVEMSAPFCPLLSKTLENEARQLGLKTRFGGVYGSVNGPRFETPAEIRAYRMLGADVIGMTLVPEIPLAREAGMCVAALAYSINWGAGMTDTIEFVTDNVEETKLMMLRAMINTLTNTKDDQCSPAKIL